MRLLVCEFITGGGRIGADLPASLAREGELMLQQVLRDLGDCPEVTHIDVLRDPRLPPVMLPKCTSLPVHLDFRQAFLLGCERADAILPVAPETDGALEDLTRIGAEQGGRLLGSRPAAVRTAASKRETLEVLAARGVPVVSTYRPERAPWSRHSRWVVKPDRSAGGEGCRLLETPLAERTGDLIVQPLVAGQSASLTLLCAEGQAALVACNGQRVRLDERGCRLFSLGVNCLNGQCEALRPLAAAVAAALPDLWGWVGVDLILTETGPRVLEVNPRLTTAYVGLRRSLNANPAQWLMELFRTGRLPRIDVRQPQPVEIPL